MADTKWLDEVNEMRRSKRPDLRSAPLRTVVARDLLVNVSAKPDEYDMMVPHWQLECGHLVLPPTDIYGERFPNRMRCRKCAAANSVKDSEGEGVAGDGPTKS